MRILASESVLRHLRCIVFLNQIWTIQGRANNADLCLHIAVICKFRYCVWGSPRFVEACPNSECFHDASKLKFNRSRLSHLAKSFPDLDFIKLPAMLSLVAIAGRRDGVREAKGVTSPLPRSSQHPFYTSNREIY